MGLLLVLANSWVIGNALCKVEGCTLGDVEGKSRDVEGCLLGLFLGVLKGCTLSKALCKVEGCALGEVEVDCTVGVEGCLLRPCPGMVDSCE